jgi:N-acetylmuramoyl-L-alanine amidase
MRPIHGIIVHCTATRPNWMANSTTSAKVAEVRRWHMRDRGWSDIGYHFLIDRDGTVAKGRPIEKTGAHTQGHNTGTIGISLFGGWDSAATDEFAENYTPQQDAALRKLIADLRAQYGNLTLAGHNNFASKACPGFNVGKWF